MVQLDKYQSATGEVYEISARADLEPERGDYESLYFRVASLSDEDSWDCIIKMSGTLQHIWDLHEHRAVYNALTELGLWIMRRAIDEGQPFREFMFSTQMAEPSYDAEIEKLKREQFRPDLAEIPDRGNKIPHVFISYVRENEGEVDRLCNELTENSIKVWLDRNDIKVGARWQDAIEDAIQNGAYFIACFSKEYNEREENFMNEELTLAIDRLRKFSTDRIWFIPAKLNKCEIPKRRISAVETLQDLQYVELYKNWNNGIQRILKVVRLHCPPAC